MDITSERLHIRDLASGDLLALHALRIDPAVYCYNHFGPESEEQTRIWIRETMVHNNLTPRLSHNCSIVLKTSGAVIGWIGFGLPSPGKAVHADLSFGYALLPGFWQRGYATEALRAMITFAFTTTDANSISDTCDVRNIASARVMEKAGLRQVERFADFDEKADEPTESYRYRILRGEWKANKREFKGGVRPAQWGGLGARVAQEYSCATLAEEENRMIIRMAQESDAPAMGRVMVETYLRAHKGQVPDAAWRNRQEEWSPEESATNWARAIRAIAEESESQECIYVAVAGEANSEQVVGLAMGGPTGVTGYEGCGDIYALYVNFAHQGRGIGRKLIKSAARQLRQLGMTGLIIRSLSTNAPANHFYESFGGQFVGECAAEDSGYPITQRIYYWAEMPIGDE